MIILLLVLISSELECYLRDITWQRLQIYTNLVVPSRKVAVSLSMDHYTQLRVFSGLS